MQLEVGGRNHGGRLVKWFPENIKSTIDKARADVESSFTVVFEKMDVALPQFRKYESAKEEDLQKIQNNQDTLHAAYLRVASALVEKLRGYTAPKDLLYRPPTEERGDDLPLPQQEYFTAHLTAFNANQTFRDHIKEIDLAFGKLNNEIVKSQISIGDMPYKTALYPA
jgi:hypothetical protein